MRLSAHAIALPLLLLLLLISLSSVGCATEWVKRRGGVGPDPVQATHLASMATGVERYEDETAVQAVVAVAQNEKLERFGLEALPRIQEVLRAEGFALEIDEARAKRLRTGLGVAEGLQGNRAATALIGWWAHPETSPMNFAYHDRWGDDYGDEARALGAGEEGAPRYFTAVHLAIEEHRGGGCGPIFSSYYPVVVLRVRVIDQAGQPVYEAQVTGEGESQMAATDRSVENLMLALDEALAKLRAMEEEPLED